MVVDSDHLDQHRGWSWRISSADICYSVCWLCWLCSLLCYLSVPSLQMSRKLFNYYIWHFYCRRPSLHHVHLLPLFGLYGKYRGLGIFPSIVIDMTETNLVYLSQFLLHDVLRQYFRYFPVIGVKYYFSLWTLPFRILKQTHISYFPGWLWHFYWIPKN